HEAYELREPSCPFRTLPAERIVAGNELALAFKDGFPVTDGHILIVPRRHVSDYLGLWQPELNAINDLQQQIVGQLRAQDSSISGFNIGTNAGASAGQTIF